MRTFICRIIFFFLFLSPCLSKAQLFKKIQQKVENKIEQKVDDVLNGKSTSSHSPNGEPGFEIMDEKFDFISKDSIIFMDNFMAEILGRMPSKWKSNGGGSIVEVPGVDGKWLKLAPRTVYKIDSLLFLPENFTVEFDLITRSESASDIGSMRFGFSRDNATKSYIMDAYNDNAITCSVLHFYNGEVTNSSSDTEIRNDLDFPFQNYSNRTFNISIAVEGQQMVLYVDKKKVLDTKMFSKEAVKHLYISSPFDYEGGAAMYMGNIRIAQ